MARKLRHSTWWTQDNPHEEVCKRVSFLEDQNRDMRLDNALYLDIQSGWNVDGNGAMGPVYWRSADRKMRRNICAAAVDTAASFIAANRTLPCYVTSGGRFDVARKAEGKGRVIHTQMWQLNAFDFGIEAFFDGAVTGTGLTFGYIDPETLRPALRRVKPNSVFVDAAEGRNPRSLFWIYFLPRSTLQANHEEHADELEDSVGPNESDEQEYLIRSDTEADMVKVVEAWHLPMRGKGGRHVVTVDNCTLVDEEFTRKRFPFARYVYVQRRGDTWFGQGLVERVLPAQLELAEISETIRLSRRLCTTSKWLVEENSNVHDGDITNLMGDILFYQGPNKPELVVWNGTPPELIQAARDLWNETLEQEGLAPGVVGGELVQKGLGSARAVRAADDVSSRRHVIATRALERYYLEVAQLLEDLNDECAALNPGYEVPSYIRSGRQQWLTSSRWTEFEIPEGEASLQMLPMAALPTTVQGRLAAVEEYIAGGFLSKPMALSLMEFPDVSAWARSETASLDLTEYQIDKMLSGIPTLPIPRQDLELAKKLINDSFLQAYRMEAPTEILDLFDAYDAHLDFLIAEKAANDTSAANQGAPTDVPPPEGGAAPQPVAA